MPSRAVQRVSVEGHAPSDTAFEHLVFITEGVVLGCDVRGMRGVAAMDERSDQRACGSLRMTHGPMLKPSTHRSACLPLENGCLTRAESLA